MDDVLEIFRIQGQEGFHLVQESEERGARGGRGARGVRNTVSVSVGHGLGNILKFRSDIVEFLAKIARNLVKCGPRYIV